MEYVLTTENLGKQYRHFKALGGLTMHAIVANLPFGKI